MERNGLKFVLITEKNTYLPLAAEQTQEEINLINPVKEYEYVLGKKYPWYLRLNRWFQKLRINIIVWWIVYQYNKKIKKISKEHAKQVKLGKAAKIKRIKQSMQNNNWSE